VYGYVVLDSVLVGPTSWSLVNDEMVPRMDSLDRSFSSRSIGSYWQCAYMVKTIYT